MRLNIYKLSLKTNKMRLNINNLRPNAYSKRDRILHHLSNHTYIQFCQVFECQHLEGELT